MRTRHRAIGLVQLSLGAGVAAVLLIFYLRSKDRPARAVEGIEMEETRAASNGTKSVPYKLSLSPASSSPHESRKPQEGNELELNPEVIYQLTALSDAVRGVGTNFVSGPAKFREQKLWLIANLMLEEIYQEQFRAGGRANINSNLAISQLTRYLEASHGK